MKTLVVIKCKRCHASYYGGLQKLSLSPGSSSELPDELSVIERKVSHCTYCEIQLRRSDNGRRLDELY